MNQTEITINNLNDLHNFFKSLPAGSESDGLSSDLNAGNFETANISTPNGEIHLHYTGPVAEGYKSPFELVSEEDDL